MRFPVPHAIWEPYDNVPFYNEPTEWHERRTDSDLLCAERCAAVPLCAGWTRYVDGACHLAAAGFKVARYFDHPAVSGLAPTEPNTPAEVYVVDALARVQPEVYWFIDQSRSTQQISIGDWGSGLYAKRHNEWSLADSQLYRTVIGVAAGMNDASITLTRSGDTGFFNEHIGHRLGTHKVDSYFLRTIDHAKSIESVLRHDAAICPVASRCHCVPCGGGMHSQLAHLQSIHPHPPPRPLPIRLRLPQLFHPLLRAVAHMARRFPPRLSSLQFKF